MARQMTLRDIGKQLGLSAMTVSLVLRDSPRISDATKKRVRAAHPGDELRAEPAGAGARHRPFEPDWRHRPQQLGPLLRGGHPRHRGRRERRPVPRAAGQRLLPDGDLHRPRARHAATAHEGDHRGAAVHLREAPASAVLEGPGPQRLRSGADQPAARPSDLPPGGGRLHGGRRDAGPRAGRAQASPGGVHLGITRRSCRSGSASRRSSDASGSTASTRTSPCSRSAN